MPAQTRTKTETDTKRPLASLPPGGGVGGPWAGVSKSRWDLQMKDPRGGQSINLRRPSQGSASPRFGCKQQEALLGTRVPGRLSLSEDWRAECGVLTLFIGLGLGSKKRGYRSEKRAESGNHLFLALSRGPGGYHLFLALSRGPGGYHRYPVWPLS